MDANLGPDVEKAPSTMSITRENTGEQPTEKSSEFLEGGTRGWLTLLGSALVQFTGLGYINTFGVYQDFYVREYLTSYSPSAIGWIGGVQLFLTFSSGLFTGSLFDRGYFHHLMITSTVLHGLGLFMLSLSHKNQYYQIFLAQGVCFGISTGLTYAPSLAIISHYFNKRRPLAIGLASGGAALGAIVHPILLNRLFNSHVGFDTGIRISASVTLSLLIVANIISRPRLPQTQSRSGLPLVEFFRDPAYIYITLTIFLAFGGLFFPIFYLQLYAIVHHVDRKFAFYALSILNAANWFGRTIPTVYAPRFGVFNLMTIFSLATAVSLFCMVAIRDQAGVVLIAIFYGFFSGAIVSLAPASVGSLAKNPAEAGARLGITFGVCGIMLLFAQPIAGALLTPELRWLHAVLFAGPSMLASAACCLVARHFVSQKRKSWKV